MTTVEPTRNVQNPSEQIELLQQSIVRLAGTRFSSMEGLIRQLRRELEEMEQRNDALQTELASLGQTHRSALQELEDRTAEKLSGVNVSISESSEESKSRDSDLAQRARELSKSLQDNRRQIEDFKQIVKDFGDTINQRIDSQEHRLLARIEQLQFSVNNPTEVMERTSPVTVEMLSNNALTNTQATADALSPIMGQAIERQITEQPQIMVDAMAPIMLQAVNSSIAQQMRELLRTIDERRREAFDFRRQFDRVMGRVKGVSEAEMMLREALPYDIERVFLIHRETSLLLASASKEKHQTADLDMVSSMLSAIRDFASEAFGTTGSGELEEITHAGKRILLEAGPYAYIAAVVDGFEPQGYNQFLATKVSQLHIDHRMAMRNFSGDMSELPDFAKELRPLLNPDANTLGYETAAQEKEGRRGLTRNQKLAVAGMLFFTVMCLALTILGGIYAWRLWPTVFPS